MTEKKGTPTPLIKPDGIITTQRNGQTIVAELFFNPNGTETFSDKLLKAILADSLRFSASDGQEPEKTPEKCPYCVTKGKIKEKIRANENRTYQAGKDH